MKADEHRKTQHESGQQLILDTIQQLKQQMDEKQVSESIAFKAELDKARLEATTANEKLDIQVILVDFHIDNWIESFERPKRF